MYKKRSLQDSWIRWGVILMVVTLAGLAFMLITKPASIEAQTSSADGATQIYLPVVNVSASTTPVSGEYILIGWNDLGMHCYNRDFSNLAVLPPFNNLWAQVVKRGDPPEIVTSGINVTYGFPDNTYSAGKSNFWDYANQLFGVNLAPNIGLAGNGLAGTMARETDHFVAEGIPLTEYSDSAPTVRDPYQLATLIAYDAGSGKELARNQVVAPVSTEMHCDYCHSDHGDGNEGIATGVVETNILTKHDQENMEDYPPGHTGSLMNRRPILCAECHSSNALGAAGVAGLPSLSHAIHAKHAEEGEIPATIEGCYYCHPGPTTKCLRGIMYQRGLTCIDCHGDLNKVKLNPSPWLNEPRCDGCHKDPIYAQNQALYRMSTGHGGMYCEACHDSTHAIAPSTQPNDAIKFVNLQGHSGALAECTVCHLTQPEGTSPHSAGN